MSFETTISNTNMLYTVEKQQIYTRINNYTFIIFESQLRHSDPRILRTIGCHKYACWSASEKRKQRKTNLNTRLLFFNKQ